MLSKIKKGINIFRDEGFNGILRAIFLKGSMWTWFLDFLFITKKKLSKEERLQIKKFKQKKVAPKTILAVEACDHHCECLPSFVHLFNKLGYFVDVVISYKEYSEKPLEYLDEFNFSCIGTSRRVMREILKKDILEKYSYVFFNSARIYLPEYSITPTIFQLFSGLKPYTGKLILVEHALELLTEEEVKKNHVIIIADLPNISENQLTIVIPDFFGNKFLEVKVQKNEKTRFITVGALNAGTRDPQALMMAIDYLHKKNIYNFEIIVIGREGNIEGMKEEYKQHICFLGRKNYPDMFDEVRSADYFLPLLDSTNETHLQYNTRRTSGSFQLIYGFRIPCIIEATFAEIHEFTNENSIIYNGNDQFGMAMQTAIEKDKNAYKNMVLALDNTARHLEEKSLRNLRKIVDME